jgi:pyridoxamine 5'-phosphate oxidase
MEFKELRKEYETQGINDAEMLDDPMATFRNWFQVAADSCNEDLFEANAMTLATADLSGMVTARVVLLKGIDADSIRFYTNYESTKGKQLAENPQASVNFHWAHLGRQVRMRGSVAKTTREDSEQYFHSRPRGSQLGAIASQQSSVIESRESLEQIRADLEKKYEGQEIPLPDFWGGYALTPVVIEFWQGRLDRMHDRVVYEKGDGSNWKRYRISP